MSDSQTGLTVTLKGGAGFEAPWIVIHADDATDAIRQLDDPNWANLASRTAAAAEWFRGIANVKAAFPAAKAEPVQQAPQQSWSNGGAPAQQPPTWAQQEPAAQRQQTPGPGPAPLCAHGPRVYREAKPGSGKDWKAWFCPTPKDTPGQCKPEFIKG